MTIRLKKKGSITVINVVFAVLLPLVAPFTVIIVDAVFQLRYERIMPA